MLVLQTPFFKLGIFSRVKGLISEPTHMHMADFIQIFKEMKTRKLGCRYSNKQNLHHRIDRIFLCLLSLKEPKPILFPGSMLRYLKA